VYVSVATSGLITFRFDYRLNGRRETLTLGSYGPDGLTLALAREKLIDARRAVADGKSPAREKQHEKRRIKEAKSFGEFANRWLQESKSAESTRAMRKSVLDRDILPAFRSRLLTEIASEDLRSLCNKVKARGAPAVAVHVRDIVKLVFAFAKLLGEKVTNPADEVSPAAIATFQPRDRALSPTEIRIMLHLLENVATYPTIRLAMRLLLLTMVRKGELVEATWDEVDFENAVWSISKERMKLRRPHNVYLSQQALDIFIALKTCAGNSRYVMPSRYDSDHHMAHPTLNRVTYLVAERAKEGRLPLEPFTVHDLRRTGSTLLNEVGFNTDWIEKCLAHEDGRSSRGTYNRAEYAIQRRHMLQEWATMISAWEQGAGYSPTLMPENMSLPVLSSVL
jgi:integrase